MTNGSKQFSSSQLSKLLKQGLSAVFVILALGVVFAALIFAGAWLFSLLSWSGVVIVSTIGALIAFFVGWLFVKERVELENIKEQLQEAKAILEVKVRARTRELEEFNRRLEETIKTKTLELRQRIDELERWHKLTVGREMKMLELKNQLEELQKQSKALRKNAPVKTKTASPLNP